MRDITNYTHGFEAYTLEFIEFTHDINNDTHDFNKGTHDINAFTHGLNKGTHEINKFMHEIYGDTHDISNCTHELVNGLIEINKFMHDIDKSMREISNYMHDISNVAPQFVKNKQKTAMVMGKMVCVTHNLKGVIADSIESTGDSTFELHYKRGKTVPHLLRDRSMNKYEYTNGPYSYIRTDSYFDGIRNSLIYAVHSITLSCSEYGSQACL